MNPTPFLSVCIITKNEGKFIEGCLQSVVAIADEIIIVDSFSTDTTKKISEKYAVSFYERKWNHDYSAARNFAIDKAQGQWILFLDADERLESPKKLLNTLQKEKSIKTGGFLMERKDIFRHKENSKISHYTVGIVRVFRNNSDIRFDYKIHEQVNSRLINNGYVIKLEKASKIIHLVEQSEDKFLDQKQTYYLSLLNKSLKQQPKEPWLCYQKAKTLWYFKRYEEALQLFLEIAQNKKNPIDIRTSSYNQTAALLIILKDFRKALTALTQSIKLIKQQSLAYSIAYNLYYEINDYENAIKSLKQVKIDLKRYQWQNMIPGDLYIYKDQKLYKLGCCYLAQNKLKKAESCFNKGIEFNPHSYDNHYGLSVMYAHLNNRKKALLHIRKCLADNPNWKEAKQLEALLSN